MQIDTGPNSTVRVKIDIFVMAVRITLQKLQLIYIQEGEGEEVAPQKV